jgi:hypothetical protein
MATQPDPFDEFDRAINDPAAESRRGNSRSTSDLDEEKLWARMAGQSAILDGEAKPLTAEDRSFIAAITGEAPATNQPTDEFDADEAQLDRRRDAELARKDLPADTRFSPSQMDSATFRRVLDHVRMGSQIDAPGTATDEQFFDDLADVWPRDVDIRDF